MLVKTFTITLCLTLLSCAKKALFIEKLGTDHMHPIAQQILNDINTYNGPGIEEMPLNQAREAYKYMQIDSSAANYNGTIVDTFIHKVKTRFYLPVGYENNDKVLLYFHGGGWVLGGVQSHDRLMRDLSTKGKVAVVFVAYKRAPEHYYPSALEEGYKILSWLNEHALDIGSTPKHIFIAGDSAGGNLATTLCLLATERNGPKIEKQFLLYPVTDTTTNDLTYQQYSEGFYLTKTAMQWFFKSYAPNITPNNIRYIAPIHMPKSSLKKMPPSLIITAEHDVLRQQGEAYAERLHQAGAWVKAIRCKGIIHDFMMLDYLKTSVQAKKVLNLISKDLKN